MASLDRLSELQEMDLQTVDLENSDDQIDLEKGIHIPNKEELEIFKRDISHIELLISHLPKSQDYSKCVSQASKKKIIDEFNKQESNTKLKISILIQENKVLNIPKETRLYRFKKINQIVEQLMNHSQQFKDGVEKRFHREIKIVYPDAKDEEINQLWNRGISSQDVMTNYNEHIFHPKISDLLKDKISGIETRYIEILELEKSVLELCELFKDMQVLITLQSEQIDSVDQHIKKTKVHAEKGEKEIVRAKCYQKNSRKMMICMLITLLIIAGVVALVLHYKKVY